MCLLSPQISLPYFPHSRSFNSLICVGSTSQTDVYGTGPHVAVFTSGCINSVSLLQHLNNESYSSWASESKKQETLSPFFSDSLFLFLSSQQLLSRGSHTPKPHAFNHAHKSLSMLQWLAPIPWRLQSQVMLMLLLGTRRFVFELM